LKDCGKRFIENKDIHAYIEASFPELAKLIKAEPNPPTKTPDQLLAEVNKKNEKLYKKAKDKAVDILDGIDAIKSVVAQLVDKALE
jgi:shikimate kinase